MTPSTKDGNGWSRYEQFVLASLERLEDGLNTLHCDLHKHCEYKDAELSKLKVNMQDLRTRVTIWGVIFIAFATTVGPMIANILQSYIRQ